MSFFISFFLSSYKPLFPHFIDLPTYIFNMLHVINLLQRVKFLFTVIHMTLATHAKLDWLVNCILSFTVHTHNTHNEYKLPPNVGLTQAHPNYSRLQTT